MLQERLDGLFGVVSHARNILILPHNNPDPDAVASAVALRQLLTERLNAKVDIAYRGIIGRAENRALVRYLERPLRRLAASDFRQSDALALVDTQPDAGNVSLPSPENRVAIVIDHHPGRDATPGADFLDVRPNVGATSTILTEYLQAAGVQPTSKIATALFYGIKADTMGLTRDTSPADAAAFCYLQSRVDMEALSRIERAQVPVDYFKSFATTLHRARVHDKTVLVYLGSVRYPDLGAEMADILLRLKGIRWVICMGIYQDELIASVRTRNRAGAGKLVREIIGDLGTAGGHGAMAGGQIPLEERNPERLVTLLSRRALRHLKVSPEISGTPLL
jgi:nanoRNase/pAp phosphatase (c-di-AMP/oligoRNAs hydrolase)